MVNFKDMTAEQLLEPPPSYDTMVKTIKSRVKAKVKRAMPRIRGKVAELGKAKVAEKKKVGKKIKKKVKKNRKEFDTIEETPEYSMNSFNTGFEGNLNLGRTASRRRAFVGVHGLRFQDKRAIEYADAGDYPTEDIFVDSQ